MSQVLLKTLNPRFRQGSILVRVSRLWEYHGGRDDGELRHIDMVLLDSEGFPMYAEVGHATVAQQGPLLAEGKVYTLKRFRVIAARNNYRAVDITCHTLIEEKNDVPSAFPWCTYRLTPFSKLSTLAGETKTFVVYIIGMITEIGAVETVHLQNQHAPTIRRTITLRDTRYSLCLPLLVRNYEMKLYLWGRRASEFDADEVYNLGQQELVVAIFVGLLVKTFRGDNSLSGNSAARWYINAELPEVSSFISSLEHDFQPIAAPPVSNHPALVNDPLPEPELRSLGEIGLISPYDFPVQGFHCTVTVSRINDLATWFFASYIRCNKTCFPKGTGFKCGTCDCNNYKFKYKICLFATDGTAEAGFIFFGNMGRRLVGKEIISLMTSCPRATDTPSQIAALVSQKYQLTINVTSKSFQRVERSYQVKCIDCAYGRQAAIPQLPAVVHVPRLAASASEQTTLAKNKAPLDQGALSSPSAAVATDVPTLTMQTPEHTMPQADDLTPPPLENPANVAELRKDPTRLADIVTTTEKRAKRRLLMDSPTSDEVLDNDNIVSITDQLEQSEDDADISVDASNPLSTRRARKAQATKRVKKSLTSKALVVRICSFGVHIFCCLMSVGQTDGVN